MSALSAAWRNRFRTGMLGSSMAMVLGFEIYGAKPPLLIKGLYRVLYRAREWSWELRYRLAPRHRYNIVRTGLEPGYYDTDVRMLYACMNLLVEHVEQGCGGEVSLQEWTEGLRKDPDPNGPEGAYERQADHQDEILSIYRWWKVQRPADEARLDEWRGRLFSGRIRTKPVEMNGVQMHEVLPTPDSERDLSMGTRQEYWAFEDELQKREQEMLHRLIDIRQGLWT